MVNNDIMKLYVVTKKVDLDGMCLVGYNTKKKITHPIPAKYKL